MAAEDYGVVVGDVSAEFPDYPAFSASTLPTSTQVTARIAVVASEVNGYLTSGDYTTAAVLANDNAIGYMQRTIVIGVAAWCARSMRGAANTRKEELQTDYRARLTTLRNDPGVLGSVYEPTSQAMGVQTHSVLTPEAGRNAIFHYSQPRNRVF